MSHSFPRHAAAPADQVHPRVNIICTHSHDPLHCLQLQGVFVTVQHLLQVVVSEEGRHWKLADSFFSSFWAHTDYRGLKERRTFFTLQTDQSLQVWLRNDSLWSEKSSLWNMETFETATQNKKKKKSKIIGMWHNPKKHVDMSEIWYKFQQECCDPVQL